MRQFSDETIKLIFTSVASTMRQQLHDYATGEVQNAHLRAAMGMSLRHSGHCLLVGGSRRFLVQARHQRIHGQHYEVVHRSRDQQERDHRIEKIAVQKLRRR